MKWKLCVIMLRKIDNARSHCDRRALYFLFSDRARNRRRFANIKKRKRKEPIAHIATLDPPSKRNKKKSEVDGANASGTQALTLRGLSKKLAYFFLKSREQHKDSDCETVEFD